MVIIRQHSNPHLILIIDDKVSFLPHIPTIVFTVHFNNICLGRKLTADLMVYWRMRGSQPPALEIILSADCVSGSKTAGVLKGVCWCLDENMIGQLEMKHVWGVGPVSQPIALSGYLLWIIDSLYLDRYGIFMSPRCAQSGSLSSCTGSKINSLNSKIAQLPTLMSTQYYLWYLPDAQ